MNMKAYLKLIKPILSLIGLTLAFLLTSFVFPVFFTNGVGDWSDSSYQQNPALLLPDQMRASYVLGFIAAIYLIVQAAMIWSFTKKTNSRQRLLALIVLSIVGFLLVVWFGSIEMSIFRS